MGSFSDLFNISISFSKLELFYPCLLFICLFPAYGNQYRFLSVCTPVLQDYSQSFFWWMPYQNCATAHAITSSNACYAYKNTPPNSKRGLERCVCPQVHDSVAAAQTVFRKTGCGKWCIDSTLPQSGCFSAEQSAQLYQDQWRLRF